MALHVREKQNRSQINRTTWRVLENHYKRVRNLHLRELFRDDKKRGENMVADGAGIRLDYSKHRVTEHTLALLIRLATDSGLQPRIDSMFRGEKINTTENRPALHVALRAPKGAAFFVDGQNVVPHVHAVLDRMARLCHVIRQGDWKGYTGKRIRNIVNIGPGAITLGPEMAYESLRSFSDRSMTFRFVSNMDNSDFSEAVQDLDPSETLFIICSKDFTSIETLANACAARTWLSAVLGNDDKVIARHFVAVSIDVNEAIKFGIDNANIFPLWSWVSDSYSLGAASSLSTMLAIGPDNFRAMLDGCHQMDMHFLATPLHKNLPVLMGLLAVWYVNFFGVAAIGVLPYEYRLKLFPKYVQLLAMESNCKQVTLIGTEVTQATGPLYWGEACGSGRHSFHQLIHQGTRLVPCDFIAFGRPQEFIDRHHDTLIASLLAEAEALAFGKKSEEVQAEGAPDWLVSHLVSPGNRPSSIILMDQLTPENLGKLVALYEHSVFTQGVIWNINSFDQWAGKLERAFAERIISELESAEEPRLEHDSSTNSLIRHYRRLKATA